MFSLAAQSSGGTSWVILIVVYAVIFGGFYMIFMRPQKKEQKRVQAMINEMEVGDTVLTTSGFYGVLIDISDEDVIVEFGSNKNCRIPMQKAAIAQVEKGFCRIKDERRGCREIDSSKSGRV
ncbi:preprotein translocase subunit YajC [Dorea longicatena]|uniref:Preprotein translocase subunit YajC n=1 Tax=Dorea longicatena TaxID=88431 RepID=A0A564URZ0_9FIRM|nr:preprotein translocase subunit YajC [Dorea longicatena]VUX22051.1 preprotein translocase subunit YajC [Dorea longicatena]